MDRGEFVEGYSRGMRQKPALAGALIHEPKLLILDEPLTGRDTGRCVSQSHGGRLIAAAPGSAVWLLRHELRLGWRGMGGKRIWLLLVGAGALWAFIHVAAHA